MRTFALVAALLLLPVPSFSEGNPGEPGYCPAEALCAKLSELHSSCSRDKKSPDCREYVTVFRSLLPTYDCRKPYASTMSFLKYEEPPRVPAIHLCDSPDFAGHMKLLDTLCRTHRDARALFSSKALREALTPELADAYYDASVAMEKGPPAGR